MKHDIQFGEQIHEHEGLSDTKLDEILYVASYCIAGLKVKLNSAHVLIDK